MRLIAVPDVPHQREADRKEDALLDADRNDRRGGRGRQQEFAPALLKDASQARDVDHAGGDREHDARQHAVRQILPGTSQEQEDNEHDPSEGELGYLASRARPLRHRRLSRTAVDDESAADRRGGVRSRKAEDVGVCVDPLLMSNRIHARRGRALRYDHHEARQGDRQDGHGFAPGDIGQAERRQPAPDRPDDRKAVFRKVQPGACGDRSDNHNQRDRELRRKFLTEQDAGDHKERKAKPIRIERRQPLQNLPKLHERSP